MKKLTCLVLVLFILLSSIYSISADNSVKKDNLQVLKELGVINDSKGFVLDKAPTKGEVCVLMTRLLGQEKEALAGQYKLPFKDVTKEYLPYVGYMYNNKLISSTSKTTFGVPSTVDYKYFVNTMLRVLGYDDKLGDFTLATALDKAISINLITNDYAKKLNSSKSFTRQDLVQLTYNSLSAPIRGGDQTLIQKLIDKGVINKDTAKSNGFELDDRYTIKVNIQKNTNGSLYFNINVSRLPIDFYYYSEFCGNDIPNPLSLKRIYASGAIGENEKAWYKNLVLTSDWPWVKDIRTKAEYKHDVFSIKDYSYLVFYNESLDPIAYIEFPPVMQNKTQYLKLDMMDTGIKADFDGYCSERMKNAVYIDPSAFSVETKKFKGESTPSTILNIDRSKLPDSIKDFKLVGCGGTSSDDITSNLFLAVRDSYDGNISGGIGRYVDGEFKINTYSVTFFTLLSEDGTILGYSQKSFDNPTF